jgi:hypothetical protein
MSHKENITRIKAVYNALGPLKDKVVFVGEDVDDKTSGIICRFKYGQTVVDVMLTEGKVLGFSNRWYPEGFGHGDGRISSDFEDMVFLLEHRSTIWQECEAAPPEVRTYLKKLIQCHPIHPLKTKLWSAVIPHR